MLEAFLRCAILEIIAYVDDKNCRVLVVLVAPLNLLLTPLGMPPKAPFLFWFNMAALDLMLITAEVGVGEVP